MFISVIIPTYNRYESLKAVLTSLANQNYPCDQYEVIAVDDGSKDNTGDIVNETFPYAFSYVRQANAGATVARNRAADQAKGDVLVFLDDDITVGPTFLSAFAEAHQQDRVIAVGNLRPVLREGMSIFEKITGDETASPIKPGGPPIQTIQYTECLTGMFSVKRAHFNEIGRLQDLVGDGRVAWGDVDFGYRAKRLGFQFVRCADAIGYHDDYSIRDFSLCAKRWQRTSESAVKLFRVYPEIRADIPMFDDKGPIELGKDSPTMVLRKLARKFMATRGMMFVMERLVAFFEKALPARGLLSTLYRWVIGGYIYRGFRDGLTKYQS